MTFQLDSNSEYYEIVSYTNYPMPNLLFSAE